MANGKKATGTPIKLGSITTKIPGIDFTDGSDAAAAYFKCVNDNGGINGHPVDFIVETHGSDPQQVGSLATKLAESDKVDAFVAGFSILDCPVNHSATTRRTTSTRSSRACRTSASTRRTSRR